MKKISCFIIFLLLAALITLPFWPWKTLVHDAIQSQLARKNIAAEFTVEEMFPGTLILNHITIEGAPTTFESLELHYNLRELFSKRLELERAILHLKDGELSVENVKIDLFRPNHLECVVSVRNVPLNLIIQPFASGKASAEGRVSGELPFVFYQNGIINIKEGKLSAGNNGVISISPDAIPGDNEQIDLVRGALSNFHYQEFSMSINSIDANKLSMLLQLRGNNPNVYNGREIKLNVRLQGNLLDIYQQSITTLTDPEKILEQK